LTRQAIIDNVDVICAVGGDGSVHEVGSELIGEKQRLAIIPMGSGNGMARHLKIPLKVRKAIKCINKNRARKVDTVSVNNRAFIGVAGIGLDALIADKFDNYKTRGFRGYISLVLKEYFKFSPIEIDYTIDNRQNTKKLLLCSVANSSEFGNGFKISPKSKMSDGNLEFFTLRKIGFFEIPLVAYRFFTKSIHNSKYAEIESFKAIEIRCSTNIIHLDGEPVIMESPYHIKVIPNSLNILVGKKKKRDEFH
jgi:YegS/Rv2252/BmrU family lipid kinase